MNIYGVRDNLKIVIIGKKQLLDNIKKKQVAGEVESPGETQAIIQFLEMNIAELENIFRDISQCCRSNASPPKDSE